MSLSFVVLLRIVFACLLVPLVQKYIADMPGRIERIWWQYAFTALLACLIILVSGENIIHPACLLVAAFGVPNAMAYYAYLRAINISQSRSAIYSPFVHIVSILLAIVVLDEWQFLSPAVCIGIVLSILGAVLLSSKQSHTAIKTPITAEQMLSFWKYVGFYTLVWGVGIFLMKVFSILELSKFSFVFWWYVGSFFGATILRSRVMEDVPPLPTKAKIWMMGLAGLLIVSMGMTYWIYEAAPVVVIQPVFQIASVFGALFIGLVLFRERGLMSRRDWLGIGSGSFGAIVIAISMAGV